MKLLRDLSYRVKIPLAISVVIVATEFVVTAALLSRANADARADLQASARNLATILGRSLRDPLVRDDLWQAFEVIRTPLAARTADNPLQAIVVLDSRGQVFVASDPIALPVTTPRDKLPMPFARLASADNTGGSFQFLYDSGAQHVAAAGPVSADDDTVIGLVLLSFDAARFRQRVRSTLIELALISVPGLLLLIPLGWFWGKAMADPLARLAGTLARVGKDAPELLSAALPESGRDEIGALAQSATLMLHDLARKQSLEREMVTTERLAAVGRVSAAIAHEINNPLGGMLNAIDTLKTHGAPDVLTRKTLGLLQRGLQQIRTTVAALLVEARLDSPATGADDWQDLKTLIEPEIAARELILQWRVGPALIHPAAQTPVPAHLVRQLVLNLLLNACKAAAPRGVVELFVARSKDALLIEVANTGAPIPAELLGHLFEPFVVATERDGKRSFGLGLWVCYQIVRQLAGSIEAGSDRGWTRFSITLPLIGET